jgi:hypothetical protein
MRAVSESGGIVYRTISAEAIANNGITTKTTKAQVRWFACSSAKALRAIDKFMMSRRSARPV